MQVNAVGDGGKGKKGKGKKGKGKGKDKNKHHDKYGDGGTGKDRNNNWNSGQRAAQFQGCCRTNPGAVAGVSEPEEKGVKPVHWSYAEDDETEVRFSSWCFAPVTPREDRQAHCLSTLAPMVTSAILSSRRLMLRDAQGSALSHRGTRHVSLTVGTEGQRSDIDFQVADISHNMLSLEKTLRNGFVFRLNGESNSTMFHRDDPTTTVSPFLHKNSLRIHARLLIQHVRLVGGQHCREITDKFAGSSIG